MRINNVLMQYQNNEFKHEIMTSPEWQRYSKGKNKGELDPDYIYEFACLDAAKLNCYNLFNKDKKQYMTLGELNQKLIKNNGYFYYFYKEQFKGDMTKVKKACIGKESFVVQSVINELLGIKKEIRNYYGIIDLKPEDIFYLVRTPYQGTGHYSMVLQKNLTYLDSFDGRQKKANHILEVIKLIF